MIHQVKKFLPNRWIARFQRASFLKRIAGSRTGPAPQHGDGFKIDFIVVGAQKAGTSALLNYLKAHPRIQTAFLKEVHFFDNDGFFDQSALDYAAYHSAFPETCGTALIGEASPNYIRLLRSHARIAAYNPEVRIIAILRHPIERAFSGWNMRHQRKNEKRSFAQAVREEMKRIQERGVIQSGSDSYLGRSLYAPQIESLKRHFPAENILFLKYEAFARDNAGALNQVYDFLGIDPVAVELKTSNVIPYDERIDDATRQTLLTFFEDDVRLIESSLGWDCSDWKK